MADNTILSKNANKIFEEINPNSVLEKIEDLLTLF
jgi:hypothetical protein